MMLLSLKLLKLSVNERLLGRIVSPAKNQHVKVPTLSSKSRSRKQLDSNIYQGSAHTGRQWLGLTTTKLDHSAFLTTTQLMSTLFTVFLM